MNTLLCYFLGQKRIVLQAYHRALRVDNDVSFHPIEMLYKGTNKQVIEGHKVKR